MHPSLEHDLATSAFDRGGVEALLFGDPILDQDPPEAECLERATEAPPLHDSRRLEHRVGIDRNQSSLERHAQQHHVKEAMRRAR